MPTNSKIQIRKGTTSDWNSANPVLASGEPGFEIDSGRLKIGNGLSAWNSLSYSYITPTGLIPGTGISIELGPNEAYCTIGVSGLSSSGIIDFNSAVDSRIENNLFNSIVKDSFLLNSASGTFIVDEGYSVGSLDVFLNGVKLSEAGGDYLATDGVSFTLSEVAPSGSVVEYLAIIPSINGGGGVNVVSSASAPTGPSIGDMWFNTDTGNVLIYLDDGNSNNWIEPFGPSQQQTTSFARSWFLS
jgi:hypothetical protein